MVFANPPFPFGLVRRPAGYNCQTRYFFFLSLPILSKTQHRSYIMPKIIKTSIRRSPGKH